MSSPRITKKPAPPITFKRKSQWSVVPEGGTVAINIANRVSASPADPIRHSGRPACQDPPARRSRRGSPHDQKADEQVDVGDEVDQKHGVEDHEVGLLDRGALPQHRQQQEHRRQHRLRENRHIRRVPSGMHPPKRRREVAVEPDDERDPRGAREPRPHAAHIAHHVESGGRRWNPPDAPADVARADVEGLEEARDDVDLLGRAPARARRPCRRCR